jgi:hypothetical protein
MSPVVALYNAVPVTQSSRLSRPNDLAVTCEKCFDNSEEPCKVTLLLRLLD